MIISIANPKGGTGKTTLAHLLARHLCQKGLSVAILSMSIETASIQSQQWPNRQKHLPMPYTVLNVPVRDLTWGIGDKLKEDILIIDPISIMDPAHYRVTSIADKAIIPVVWSPISFNTTKEFLQGVQYEKRFKMRVALLRFPGTEDSMEEARKKIESTCGHKVLEHTIPWVPFLAGVPAGNHYQTESSNDLEQVLEEIYTIDLSN